MMRGIEARRRLSSRGKGGKEDYRYLEKAISNPQTPHSKYIPHPASLVDSLSLDDFYELRQFIL